jgi:hypothetical protein
MGLLFKRENLEFRLVVRKQLKGKTVMTQHFLHRSGRFALELTAKRASFPHSEHSFRVVDYHLVECPALVDHYTSDIIMRQEDLK